MAKQTDKYIEEEFIKEKRTRSSSIVPDARQRFLARDISGLWQRGNPGFDGATFARIKLFPVKPNVYKVLFTATDGCMLQWHLERMATYQNGILTLNRPVKERAFCTYDRLFTVRTPEGVRLLPDWNITNSQKMQQMIQFCEGFSIKTAPKPALVKRRTIVSSPKPTARAL